MDLAINMKKKNRHNYYNYYRDWKGNTIQIDYQHENINSIFFSFFLN